MPEQNDNLSAGESPRTGAAPDPKKEEAYWREHHDQQPYADKSRSYEDYAHAYRAGYEGFGKHAGKKYEEIEDDLALNYERARPGSAIPWDTVRPAAKAAWDRMSGVIAPRDPDRGVRGSI
ncbi:MAG: hypothetical protein QOI34_129 [Verrucomicrobiota bacterium]|jgi:hypothetical protein